MSDIRDMLQLVEGLTQKKKNLQADEAIFLKLSGINEEIEKAVQDKAKYDLGLEGAKERRDDLRKRKAGAVAETTNKIEVKMNEVLPSGRAVFSYTQDDDDKFNMVIGWRESSESDNGDVTVVVNTKTTPYNGLSGMQKQVFDSALANVLDANIIVLEAAELDSENLEKTLIELSKLDKQVIVSTCHPINETNLEPFKVIEV